MRFYCLTLGCKVNQYETQALRESWLRAGWSEAATLAEAGLILVNSCAVTAKAVADVRSSVRQAHRLAPQAAIVLTGCAAEALPEELATLPGVSKVIPQHDKALLLDLPLSCAEQLPSAAVQGRDFPPFAVSGYDRARAVLKVQDGCSHHCTYCIVPLTRGPARSRAPDEVLAEARRLLAAGFCELTVSGVNLRQYHWQKGLSEGAGPADFWDLLLYLEHNLAGWAGKARLRLSSLEPGQLGEKALAVLGKSRLVAPHLHLSLQSGSPTVLQKMGRGHYNPALVLDVLRSLRHTWPVFGLGADILAGFPGETEVEHEDTLALCAALPLSYAHVFPYSRRPGTAAASLPGQLPSAIKKQRAASLRQLVAAKKQDFLQAQLTLPSMDVVFESGVKRQGINEFYVDCQLAPTREPLERRALVLVKPLSIKGETLVVA